MMVSSSEYYISYLLFIYYLSMPAKFELDRYDAEVIANHYKRLPLQVWGRCLNIFVPLLSLFWSLWWDRKTQQSDRKAKLRAIQVRQLLTRLGPAFIKIGQALSTRPDIVPAIYMDELSQLQDQLPAFPNQQAFQFIHEELGAIPQEIYAEISANPIAAASLGQVYKGRLRTGEQVAIKVQRPDINEAIALDMYILRGLSAWAMQSFKFIRSNLVGILDEFASRIFEEMDYTCEGANADRFGEYYGQLEEIYVPKIYWKYTARRVLTMEWIEGTKLTELEKIKQMGFDSRHIIEVGVQCSLRQLLDQGFFHADPHPGNLLVMSDGKLAYLDFGMMSQVSSEQRYGLIEAIIHLVNRDFAALSKDYVKLGFLTETVNLDQITPALAQVFNAALGSSVAELDFKEMTDQLSQVMYEYPFQVPAYYALIIRSLVTLEGIALNVDPNFKVLSVAYPYVANRLLTDSNPELRNSLKDLLFRDGEFRWTRLENLLKNAKSNQDYNLKETIHQVSDFLLSERGEYMRIRLADEIVKGIEKEAFSLIPNPFSPKPQPRVSKSGSSLSKLMGVWSTISQDQNIQPLEFAPLAGQILAKPETQELGRNIVWQLTQRAIARMIRELALKTQEVPELITPELVKIVEPIETPTVFTSKPSRELNGKTW
ncbi:putative unusual protein kinase [Synechococcus sp. PCC 7502]|uniref:ABC1 kinase family protein n=1 Tax=Synechococcus sp. PCC 7502 TaxID=1173263 RepID=UPI00029FE95A|nr:AarF/ABC1/UbiB kinase family protein [Synechococcus sp. PCC 7502]AFY75192.1 putative unusual protein kinase [Synechococcus sp. PCC 7502]